MCGEGKSKEGEGKRVHRERRREGLLLGRGGRKERGFTEREGGKVCF